MPGPEIFLLFRSFLLRCDTHFLKSGHKCPASWIITSKVSSYRKKALGSWTQAVERWLPGPSVGVGAEEMDLCLMSEKLHYGK
jgi:hypothetical protein